MIFYFSGTGNSHYTAQRLASEDESVIDICTADKDYYKDKKIGLVFPVYCGDIPYVFADFLRKVKLDADYFYAVATCAATTGNCYSSVQYLLNMQGANLCYKAKVLLPDSCIVFYNTESEKKQMLDAEDSVLDALKNKIADTPCVQIEAKRPHSFFTRMMWKMMKVVYGIDKKRATAACNGCGKCEKICPMHNIKTDNGRIIFGKNCENCFRCIQSCPNRAIRFGVLKVTDKTAYLHK